jgi:hypothetical protein
MEQGKHEAGRADIRVRLFALKKIRCRQNMRDDSSSAF